MNIDTQIAIIIGVISTIVTAWLFKYPLRPKSEKLFDHRYDYYYSFMLDRAVKCFNILAQLETKLLYSKEMINPDDISLIWKQIQHLRNDGLADNEIKTYVDTPTFNQIIGYMNVLYLHVESLISNGEQRFWGEMIEETLFKMWDEHKKHIIFKNIFFFDTLGMIIINHSLRFTEEDYDEMRANYNRYQIEGFSINKK